MISPWTTSIPGSDVTGPPFGGHYKVLFLSRRFKASQKLTHVMKLSQVVSLYPLFIALHVSFSGYYMYHLL
jgi:hypothetical protein